MEPLSLPHSTGFGISMQMSKGSFSTRERSSKSDDVRTMGILMVFLIAYRSYHYAIHHPSSGLKWYFRRCSLFKTGSLREWYFRRWKGITQCNGRSVRALESRAALPRISLISTFQLPLVATFQLPLPLCSTSRSSRAFNDPLIALYIKQVLFSSVTFDVQAIAQYYSYTIAHLSFYLHAIGRVYFQYGGKERKKKMKIIISITELHYRFGMYCIRMKSEKYTP